MSLQGVGRATVDARIAGGAAALSRIRFLAAKGHRGDALKNLLRDDQTLTAVARRRALELAPQWKQ